MDRADVPDLRDWREAVRPTLALIVGVFPTGIAFGVVAIQAGLSTAEAMLISGIIIAGASQFALVGLLDGGASALAASLTATFLNLRHLLYGPTIAPYFKHFGTTETALGSLVLTDEVFAVSAEKLPRKNAGLGWLMVLEAGLYGSWLSGTLVGALGGATVVGAIPSLAPALSFALPALFAALLVSMLGHSRAGGTVTAASVAIALAAILHIFGLTNVGILAAGIVGPAIGVMFTSSGKSGD